MQEGKEGGGKGEREKGVHEGEGGWEGGREVTDEIQKKWKHSGDTRSKRRTIHFLRHFGSFWSSRKHVLFPYVLTTPYSSTVYSVQHAVFWPSFPLERQP